MAARGLMREPEDAPLLEIDAPLPATRSNLVIFGALDVFIGDPPGRLLPTSRFYSMTIG